MGVVFGVIATSKLRRAVVHAEWRAGLPATVMRREGALTTGVPFPAKETAKEESTGHS
jgi:hypothetical protein